MSSCYQHKKHQKAKAQGALHSESLRAMAGAACRWLVHGPMDGAPAEVPESPEHASLAEVWDCKLIIITSH